MVAKFHSSQRQEELIQLDFWIIVKGLTAGLFIAWCFNCGWNFFHFSEVQKNNFLEFVSEGPNVRNSLKFWVGSLCILTFLWKDAKVSKLAFAISAVVILNLAGLIPVDWVDGKKDIFFAELARLTSIPKVHLWSAGVVGLLCVYSFFKQEAKIAKIFFVAFFFLFIFLSVKVSDEQLSSIGKRIAEGSIYLWGNDPRLKEAAQHADKSKDGTEKKTIPEPEKTEVSKKSSSLPPIPKLAGKDVTVPILQIIGPNTEQAEMAFLCMLSKKWEITPDKKILGEYRNLQDFYYEHRTRLIEDENVIEERARYLSLGSMKLARDGLVEPISESEENLKALDKLRSFLKKMPPRS